MVFIVSKMLLSNFSSGPLDFYRKKSSFDWKKMKIFVETEEMVKYQNDIYEALKSHPAFQEDILLQSYDEQKRVATRRAFAFSDIKIFSVAHILENLKRAAVCNREMMLFCNSSGAKYLLATSLFPSILIYYGTQRHSEILVKAANMEIVGCFCMTEIAHGSNTKGIKTTATYDKETQQFILDTPDFEAAKCWAGGLGQFASYAVVFAQLYLNGVCHGMHMFVVPIRDPKTLLPYLGVTVGDMGEKIGLNGLDNGFLMFENYRIPREYLLNKNADVTSDGKYVTSFKTTKDRHGAALGALSIGRVNIIGLAEGYGTKALTIAIRYAAVRKQFGPDGEPEVPILEYQSHQLRLFPYLAAAYVFRIVSKFLIETTYRFTFDKFWNNRKGSFIKLGLEIHVLSSGAKPLASWLFRDAIQECREACGGHGYLKVAGIGDIRNDNDANCTYEGENHVLIQQTSNWLLKLWPDIEKGAQISTPMKSANFLSNTLQILNHKFRADSVDSACKPQTISDAYQWLVCYLLKETKNKLDSLTSKRGEFWARNDIQVFYAKSLAIAFIQHFFLQRMIAVISEAIDVNIKNVLLKLLSLYGLWSLEKFLPTLYEGGYVQGPQPAQIIHEAILKLCSDIKDDAVSLIDAIAPPDFILNSVLGASDGQVYQRLKAAMFSSPYCMSRPSWWRDVVNWNSSFQNKL